MASTFERRGVRHARERDVAVGDDGGGRCAFRRPLEERLSAFGFGPIPHHDVVSRLDEVCHHARTHDPQTKKPEPKERGVSKSFGGCRLCFFSRWMIFFWFLWRICLCHCFSCGVDVGGSRRLASCSVGGRHLRRWGFRRRGFATGRLQLGFL
jgi:hypothetical protein